MIIKRSITIKGHSTSISLEATFWDALNEIAKKQDISIASLVAEIDTNRRKESTQKRLSKIQKAHGGQTCGYG